MTVDEKKKILRDLTGDKLLAAYRHYYSHFDPMNLDSCESYELIKREILYRCRAFDEIKEGKSLEDLIKSLPDD